MAKLIELSDWAKRDRIYIVSRFMLWEHEYCSFSSSEQLFFNLNYSILTWITAPFNDMRTLKFKAQVRFSLPSVK